MAKKGFLDIRDNVIKEKTGRNTIGWNKVLDMFNVRKKGHTLAAKMLREKYALSPWWAQVIAIRYEYQEGLRR